MRRPSAALPASKVVIAGDGNVGKSSLIRQFCEGRFEASRVATIGVDFQTKVVTLGERQVKLSIWDMAGQARFAMVRAGFYRGSRAAALVFDMTRPDSLTNLVNWHQEIIEAVSQQSFLVVGNKSDLCPDYDATAAKQFARRIGAAYVATSALSGQGVELMFARLAMLASPA